MQNVLAYDLKSGEKRGLVHASDLEEADRYSAQYKCLNPACGCTFHWRRKVEAKENTDIRPATFVKNKSSSHLVGCSYDYKGLAQTHRDVVSFDGSDMHIRLSFQAGSAPKDRMPMVRGMLSEQQKMTANNNIGYRGVGSLSELTSFLEKHFQDGLEDPALDDLVLHYQGDDLRWNDCFISSEDYKSMLDQARRGDQSLRLTLIKPSHSVRTDEQGKYRYVCEGQYAQDRDRKSHFVQPVIVTRNPHVRMLLDQAAEWGSALLVSGRPFMPAVDHTHDRYVYFNCDEDQQISGLNRNYWRVPVPGARHQISLDLTEPYMA